MVVQEYPPFPKPGAETSSRTAILADMLSAEQPSTS